MEYEEWRPVVGTTAMAVSDQGRFFSWRKGGHYLFPWKDYHGLVRLTLWRNNRSTTESAAKIVLRTFRVYDPKLKIAYLDGNAANVAISNLKQVTLSSIHEEKNMGFRKLTREIVEEIRYRFMTEPYRPQYMLGKEYNISANQVSRILNRRRWK
jgi:hypothetical protein